MTVAVAPFFALNYRSDTTPKARQYVGGTVNDLGSSFGVLDDNTAAIPNSYFRRCPIVQFPTLFGTHTTERWCAFTGGTQYDTTDGGTTWTPQGVASPLFGTGLESSCSGLYPLYTGSGVPKIATIWHNGSNAGASYSTDGITWTHVTGPALTTTLYPLDEVVYKGKLYILCFDFIFTINRIITFDPGSNTVTMSSSPGIAINRGALVNFNGQLIAYQYSAIGVSVATQLLYDVSAGIWSLFATLRTDDDAGSGSIEGRDGMYISPVDGKLHVIAYSHTNSGLREYEVTTAGVVTDVTASYLPLGLQSGLLDTGRAAMVVDHVTDPGTNAPSINLFFANDGSPGSAWAIYQFDNSASPKWVATGSGGSSAHAISAVRHSNGSFFFSASEFHVEQTAKAAGIGTVTYTLKVFGDSATTINIRGWFTSSANPYARTAATLTGTLSGVAATTGTTFSPVWQTSTDGITSGSFPQLVWEIYV